MLSRLTISNTFVFNEEAALVIIVHDLSRAPVKHE